MMYTTSIG